jgi:hypothetical protein
MVDQVQDEIDGSFRSGQTEIVQTAPPDTLINQKNPKPPLSILRLNNDISDPQGKRSSRSQFGRQWVYIPWFTS